MFALIFELLYLWAYFASARLNFISFLSLYDIGLNYIYFLCLTLLVAVLSHAFLFAKIKAPEAEGVKRKGGAHVYIYAALAIGVAGGVSALKWLAVQQNSSVDRVAADLLSKYVVILEAPVVMAVLFSLGFILLVIWLIESRKILNGTYRDAISAFIAFLLILTPLAGLSYGFSKRVWWLISETDGAAMEYWAGSQYVISYREGRLSLQPEGR
ncbi:hypothetical protein [Asticcacaulis sp. AND118]|uniref:hypothetical protein n=1 Tax=Asticcacaulis sp. AND118 TaxID=2840468 RepID=UPI001CFF6481|nr:hypothetical protein [Asticcacaulis sp. AND118]UDF04146.1 hypothetical protein LH365_03635 [Asticcacaulis sp. AND118]